MDIEEYSKHKHLYAGNIPKHLLKFFDEVGWISYLDLGCGDGSLLYALNKNGYFKNKIVYAVDLSENRIKIVKKINRDFNCFISDACYVQDIKINTIDFLVTTQVIEHVLNDEDMIKEFYRILNKNKILYLSTVFKKWYGWYFYRCNGKWTLDPTHLREYTQDNQLLDILKEYNFEVIVNKKSLFYFPLFDFIFRKTGVKSNIYENRICNFLRNFKIPIIGYYNWEIVCRKN